MSEAHKVRPGGLMRCCIETVSDQETAHAGEAKEGDRLTCKYGCGGGQMVLRDGAWEWDR